MQHKNIWKQDDEKFSMTIGAKREWREKLKKDTQAFLEKGGAINDLGGLVELDRSDAVSFDELMQMSGLTRKHLLLALAARSHFGIPTPRKVGFGTRVFLKNEAERFAAQVIEREQAA